MTRFSRQGVAVFLSSSGFSATIHTPSSEILEQAIRELKAVNLVETEGRDRVELRGELLGRALLLAGRSVLRDSCTGATPQQLRTKTVNA